MRTATAAREAHDLAEAVAEIGAALRASLGGDPHWLVLCHDSSIDKGAVTEAWRRVAPGVPVHRLTSSGGVMGDFGLLRPPALAAFAVRDPGGAYAAAAEPLDGGAGPAVARALARASAAAGRPGEAPELVLLSTVPGAEEAVLTAISEELGGGVPVAGGTAGDNAVAGEWWVGDAEQSHRDGLVISLLYTSKPPSFGISSGYLPTGVRGVVTAVRGRVVLTIDGRPAAEVYDGWTGGAIREVLLRGEGAVLGSTTMHPIGRCVARRGDDSRYLLAHPEAVYEGGALGFFAELAVGEEIELMQGSRESLITRAGRVVQSALRSAPSPLAGAITVYCAGCMLAVGERMTEVQSVLQGAIQSPWIGLFTFGEQGCPTGSEARHGNLMISVVALHE